MDERLYGLTTDEVVERQRTYETGAALSITKSTKRILSENIFTLFNFLNFGIAVMLFLVGAYSNMLFIGIIILNIAIGIAQELKAKKLVDELSILNCPKVRVRRNGEEQIVDMTEIVPDDLVVLSSGDQIGNDAVIVSGELEVNESLLTGESDAVIKEKGKQVLSGSFVISGKAYAKVIHVGNENYATRLANKVKQQKKTASELLGSMNRLTSFTSCLILPLGVLLFIEALFVRHMSMADTVVSSSAALLGMLPKGLVLLIAVSLAAGVIRLAKMKILVQNIYSLETLAHIDTLCLDKTGTLTDGKLEVKRAIPLGRFSKAEIDGLIGSYLAASDDNNVTFQALTDFFQVKSYYQAVHKIPFSSKRKWGAVSLDQAGTVFVGAPDRLLPSIPENLEQEMEHGRRVVVIGYIGRIWTDTEHLPADIEPLYGVIMEDRVRRNAARTLKFFKKEGVDIKIISGDHPKTVAMIAKRAGLDTWNQVIDMSELDEDVDYDVLCNNYSVFARVSTGQKQGLVHAMKAMGHQLAMTGDGVNDLLALKEADCSIAVADGSDASRQLAQIVLLDSDFTYLPKVVMEGRRVVNNVTRTAGVFFIKTIYSLLVSVFCLIKNVPFPFIPIQITLIDACIEAYPSFLSIVEADTRRIKGRFLSTALKNAAPFGITAAVIIALSPCVQPFIVHQGQTATYLILILISMAAVVKSCHPFNKLRIFISITMVVGTFFALFLFPSLLQITAVSGAMIGYILIGAGVSAVLIWLLWSICREHTFEMPMKGRAKTRISGN